MFRETLSCKSFLEYLVSLFPQIIIGRVFPEIWFKKGCNLNAFNRTIRIIAIVKLDRLITEKYKYQNDIFNSFLLEPGAVWRRSRGEMLPSLAWKVQPTSGKPAAMSVSSSWWWPRQKRLLVLYDEILRSLAIYIAPQSLLGDANGWGENEGARLWSENWN